MADHVKCEGKCRNMWGVAGQFIVYEVSKEVVLRIEEPLPASGYMFSQHAGLFFLTFGKII